MVYSFSGLVALVYSLPRKILCGHSAWGTFARTHRMAPPSESLQQRRGTDVHRLVQNNVQALLVQHRGPMGTVGYAWRLVGRGCQKQLLKKVALETARAH